MVQTAALGATGNRKVRYAATGCILPKSGRVEIPSYRRRRIADYAWENFSSLGGILALYVLGRVAGGRQHSSGGRPPTAKLGLS